MARRIFKPYAKQWPSVVALTALSVVMVVILVGIGFAIYSNVGNS